MANGSIGDVANLTPVMRQYRAAKDSHPDALLFFRLGDFYELFFEDAVVASRELQLTLTSRDKSKNVPMCGVPYHAAEAYLQRLLRKGYRIALCEQMEDPKLTKNIVRREVTRVLTPGTAVDPSLGAEQSNWLSSLCIVGSGRESRIGLALLDLSTGEFRATESRGEDAWSAVVDEVARARPVELVHGAGWLSGRNLVGEQEKTGLESVRTKTAVEEWVFTPDYAIPLLQRQFGVMSLDGLGLAGHDAAATAAGGLIHYMQRTKQGGLEHVEGVRFYERSSCLELDAVSVRNLELIEPLFSGETVHTTLFHTLDACTTPMGKRLLRATLLRPANDLIEIEARLEAVDEATTNLRQRENLRRSMGGVLDLERLLGRVALDSAGPREVVALASTLSSLPGIVTAAEEFKALRWRALSCDLDAMEDLRDLVTGTLSQEPPVNLSEGGAIRIGVDAELDELRGLSSSGRQAIAAIEDRERARTGIGSLKVRFNSIFGYYLEVTKANAKAVPPDYERKQTLVNAERFTTAELKELETRILTAQERCGEIERRIFANLRQTLLQAAPRMRATARRVAEIDLLVSFAHLAAMRGWVRPEIEKSEVLEFVAARHPVVEQRLEDSGSGRFVPNSLYLDAAEKGPAVLLITGPNMGGKSTYLRTAALLVIMVQCGSFVPAERMRLGLVDRVFTRIGASDNVARGRSTFMVEMTETAAILNTASSKSLVLLDEMGRGTATYDGLSLAWATVEHLHNNVRARTLFATHYHELTMLEHKLTRLKNVRVTVKETAGGIVFLHTVEAGPANKSYGIEVARLAGLPKSVISRAREVLKVHERAESDQVASALEDHLPQMQMTMFTPLSQRVVDTLREINLDEMTPREALNLLADLQREVKA